jgi:TATA-box binding protein (TBP) (component of TFIID and TFIIIB)
MVKTVIVNVVSTAHLQQKLDLHELEQFKEILHDTEIYGGRVAYFRSPTRALHFPITSSIDRLARAPV